MFRPPLALASLSGEADAAWARQGVDYAGAAFLGGIALDDDSRAAARKLVERDRTEFLPADPVAFVDRQLEALEDVPIQPAFNVRSATPEPVADAARVCRDREAYLEINAHCRQAELCAVGCGETLLKDTERLARHVETAADTGATVGVKVRAEVSGVDLPALAGRLEDAGATFVHVDAMDTESVIEDVVDASDLFVIANNGVRDDETVRKYVDYGADAVSVGRPSDNQTVLERVLAAVERRLVTGTP
ncbi:tRNA-dihydrouridine synthase [Natronobacterium gregoryi]|uniref:Dihydropyrimidine dehydrogenase n=2 Tax=Natronobacterium gregoryi TaxID=44930 RepID=L0ACI7_NATGS|nr:tRNA-dihydrouridine synthase [Natronobacterium gregoryi]AFZ71581.1 tRNA-dihydrouridine synthase [Natronobacterium gregoryi SP2]ELY66638.1 dihydropyrimidine dehydrogenase [Natronobacterium gregoryi SP2]PLK21350.1 dihydropyrimidine dehydrogenase [Natronobacterium gregoryi SP2]SFI81243.1 TIM-barrel protein, putative [Natronobacterium gregoryi]